MKNIFLQHKKGVSEIVSYVILIIIAISVSVLVYNYLSDLVPKPRPECNEGTSLSIESYNCTLTYLNLTVKNRGRFNIEAAYIRIGNITAKTKYWINPEQTNKFQYAHTLSPNESPRFTQYFFAEDNPVVKNGAGNYILEIQLAYYDNETKKYAACTGAINQVITCAD